MEKELRYAQMELRAVGDESTRTIGGYAAVFNSTTEIFPMLNEKIAKGAFADSLKEDDIRALWSHNPDVVLGRNKNNTLKLWEDDHGLAFELALPDTEDGRSAFVLIKRGDVTGMSFGFQVKKDSWEMGEKGKPHIRTLEKVKLFEVSPVAYPAYDATSVGTRSLADMIKAKETEWMYEQKAKLDDGKRGEILRLIRKLELEISISPNILVH